MKMNCEYFNKNIKIKKCTSSDVDSICNIQNIVIDNDPINDGEIYGAFIDDKMVT